jgi:hypothetical protein
MSSVDINGSCRISTINYEITDQQFKLNFNNKL